MSDPHESDAGDSAHQPWAGRELPSTGFDQDTGRPDPALLAAMGADDTTFMQAIATARVLVPIVAASQETEELANGLGVEKSTQMAVVTLTAPDGERALPIFTGMPAMLAWNPQARPRPMPTAQAAQAAVAEGCDVLVLDVGSPKLRVVRPSMVWALAMDRAWLPAHADLFVQDAVARAVHEEPDVTSAMCEDGDAGAMRVVLYVGAGLAAKALQQLCARIGERIATDGETRARIDALSFRIVTAG